VPCRLTTDLPVRPSPAVETIAYHCVAELLTNVAKHSGASRATVAVAVDGGVLHLRVTDDGAGGARLVPGHGLAGLADRVRTVDGWLTLSSPAGGPTEVAIGLPVRA
jgi:signal transduction histidine kinase